MVKINNWEEITEAKLFTKLPAGGYICAIKNVTDIADKQYLQIEFDIVEGDYKGYFQKQYDNSTFVPKRWSGVVRQSYKQTALSRFKGVITSIEKSNKNFKWDFDEQKLKNKYVGMVIAYEEYVKNNGSVGERMYVDSIHSVDRIKEGDFNVPELKRLNVVQTTNHNTPAVNPFGDSNPFGETQKNELPFDVDVTTNPFADDDSNPFA